MLYPPKSDLISCSHLVEIRFGFVQVLCEIRLDFVHFSCRFRCCFVHLSSFFPFDFVQVAFFSPFSAKNILQKRCRYSWFFIFFLQGITAFLLLFLLSEINLGQDSHESCPKFLLFFSLSSIPVRTPKIPSLHESTSEIAQNPALLCTKSSRLFPVYTTSYPETGLT